MTKHLADHRSTPSASRLMQFLRIARDRSETAWRVVWQRPQELAPEGRRVVEYARIERGRQV